MENRKYLIINTSEINKVDFQQIEQHSPSTLLKTKDGIKCIIKWSDKEPTFLKSLNFKEGPFSIIEINEILDNSEEWN